MDINEKRQRQREATKRHYWKHREKHIEYNHQYRLDNLEKERERNLKYRRENPEKRNAYSRKYNATHREHLKMVANRWRTKIKIETLTHYGNGKCACVRCGESRLACLSLDHIKSDGAIRRKENGLGGTTLYLNLHKRGFPNEGVQTLCMNCQFIKRIEEKECGKRGI